MASSRDFSSMLNEHLSYDLLKAEALERMWLLNNVERDDSWLGGTLVVPFKGAQASSLKWGGLSDASDIAASAFVRGQVSSYKECWGSISFYHTDLIQHGKLSEQNFLKILPDELDDFMMRIKTDANLNMLNGFAALVTADGDASGNITVDHPERFTLGQKVFVDDDNSSVSSACYVRTINQNTGVLTLYDARTGGSVVNLSGYAASQNAKIYLDGTEPGTDNGFTSLRSQLLSSVNGGSTSLFGQTKTAYPYLQAINQDGSNFTEDNILEGLFNKWVTIRNRAGGNPNKALMSFKNFAAIMKNLESGKGAYHQDQKSTKVSAYGWQEISVLGPAGGLSLVAVQEMEDDVIMVLDPKSIKFHSNGFFRKRVAPDGKSFYETRATTGYTYIVDIMLFGELVVNKPTANGIIHSIDFSLSET